MKVKATLQEVKDFVNKMEIQDENDHWSFAFQKVSEQEYKKYLAFVRFLKREGEYEK